VAADGQIRMAAIGGITFGWWQDQVGERDFLGLFARRVAPGDPGESSLPWAGCRPGRASVPAGG